MGFALSFQWADPGSIRARKRFEAKDPAAMAVRAQVAAGAEAEASQGPRR
jgi:hypothetical protein